ncbi:hypothetical protein, partial [Staphylococcus aureus]|uniref:hypothetical protein n=1 Tax=Staphylococcus aureus TaxID=1280 RepID=UPI001C5BF70C
KFKSWVHLMFFDSNFYFSQIAIFITWLNINKKLASKFKIAMYCLLKYIALKSILIMHQII